MAVASRCNIHLMPLTATIKGKNNKAESNVPSVLLTKLAVLLRSVAHKGQSKCTARSHF